MWNFNNNGWSPHRQLVLQAALINIFNAIWNSRNAARFNNKCVHWQSATASIITVVSLTASNSFLAASTSMLEFSILKAFNCKINPPKFSLVKQVIWSPPIFNWIKCNCDGATIGNPGLTACGGTYRNNNSQFLGCFAEGLDRSC